MCYASLHARSQYMAGVALFLAITPTLTYADTRLLLDALENRHDQFPTFQIAWKVVQIEPGKQPSGHTTYEMLVNADCFRIVRRVEGMADPMSGSATSFKDIFTDDGNVQHSFVCDFSESGRTPTGNRSLNGVGGTRYSFNDNVLPMLLYFRPNAARLHRFEINKAKVTTAESDQTRILAEAGRHDTLWQSTAPFQLQRWEFVRPETEPDYDHWTTTIEYAPAADRFADPSDAVIPVAFKVVRTSSKGDTHWIKEAKVTAWSSSPEVSSDAFVIDYPEGTPVINGDNPDQKFVVRADKSFRPVSANDSLKYATWLEIARAPVDAEVAHLDEAGSSWPVYLFVCATVALIAFAVRRMRRSLT